MGKPEFQEKEAQQMLEGRLLENNIVKVREWLCQPQPTVWYYLRNFADALLW